MVFDGSRVPVYHLPATRRTAEVPAGQVYRLRLSQVDAPDGPVDGLAVGSVYAMKLLVPPSRLGRFFRNAIYALGVQGPFPLQSNPAALRAAALRQKLTPTQP